MTGDLARALVCTPRSAGWNRPDKLARWHDLGFHHALDFTVAESQHDDLCRLLTEAGAVIVPLLPSDSLSLDAIYTHDASFPTAPGIKRVTVSTITAAPSSPPLST
jgi:N-dimethylarginine dimethylaminohydrolase